MAIVGFDHMKLPTVDPEKTFAFYKSIGLSLLFEEEWRSDRLDKFSIVCGDNKINVRPGSDSPVAHLCMIWEGGMDALLKVLEAGGITVGKGPVPRLGGRGGGVTRGVSVYVRDPAGTVLEFISYDQADIDRYPGPTAEEAYQQTLELAAEK